MRYDLHFTGEIKPGEDPTQVRVRLQGLFRLSNEVAALVFSGRTLALKRGLEWAQAERLRQVFLDAGALVRLVAQDVRPRVAQVVDKPSGPLALGVEDQVGASALAAVAAGSAQSWYREAEPVAANDQPRPVGSEAAVNGDQGVTVNPGAPAWQLASQDDRPLEQDPGLRPPALEISHLRLIEGQDWSLADCDLGQPAVVLPDISHLHIHSRLPYVK